MLQDRPTELDTFMAYQVQSLNFALAPLIHLEFVAWNSEAFEDSGLQTTCLLAVL